MSAVAENFRIRGGIPISLIFMLFHLLPSPIPLRYRGLEECCKLHHWVFMHFQVRFCTFFAAFAVNESHIIIIIINIFVKRHRQSYRGGAIWWTRTKAKGRHGVVCRLNCVIHVWAPWGRDTCHLGRYINSRTFTRRWISLRSCWAVSTQYRRITDGGRTDRHLATA